MKSAFLKDLIIHEDWKEFFSIEIEEIISTIESEILCGEFTPSVEKVLRFFELPLHSVKVLILGQDPYPQPGVATGRAFEVGDLKSWNEPFKNISLKNIIRALYKAYSGKILKFNEIKEKFDNEFPLLPPGKLFRHWEKQGVLLLNTSFTCIPGNPGSHKKIWGEFSFQLLSFINKKYPSITWFLWGNHAFEATFGLGIVNSIKTQHPMMCFDGNDREMDFLYGKINCFEKFKNQINWTGFEFKNGFKLSNTLF